MATGILHLQERQKVAMFVRRDPFGRYVSCLVYVPRDRYTTRLRRQLQNVLSNGFGGQVTAFYTQLSDEVLARLHFIVKTEPGKAFPKKVGDIEVCKFIFRRVHLPLPPLILLVVLVEHEEGRESTDAYRE